MLMRLKQSVNSIYIQQHLTVVTFWQHLTLEYQYQQIVYLDFKHHRAVTVNFEFSGQAFSCILQPWCQTNFLVLMAQLSVLVSDTFKQYYWIALQLGILICLMFTGLNDHQYVQSLDAFVFGILTTGCVTWLL